jgi:hypothetical protein
MKNNAYIYERDGIKIHLMTAEEVVSLFGEEYLEQYGHYVPKELLNRYLELNKELEQVLDELERIKDEAYWAKYE